MTTTPPSPKVIILCRGTGSPSTTTEEKASIQSAQTICNLLQSHFTLRDVSIRIIQTGGDARLLSLLRNEKHPKHNTIYAILSDNKPGTMGILECVETHSSCPYVMVNIGQTDRSALHIAKLCGLVSDVVRRKVEEYLWRMHQAVMIQDGQLKTQSWYYKSRIASRYDKKSQITGDKVGPIKDGSIEKKSGKVRDRYDLGDDRMALVTTDRQSGFDRMLALVPYKGQVLNLTSSFWFRKTEHILPNHLLEVPHPNVSIVKKCKPFSIEFVVRAYLTGSTSTSIWKNYESGVRDYCGHCLPEHMKKNQKLPNIMLTPTTKEESHDNLISAQDIIQEGWMTQTDFDTCAKAALECFAVGQKIASQNGLILVDTKYEFGKELNSKGQIMLIDEMHTPDSSRYWIANSYEERFHAGLEPENIDKEFLRLWFRDHCDPYKDDTLPEAPKDLVCELSRRYITLFEMITLKDFEFGEEEGKGEEEIADVIRNCL